MLSLSTDPAHPGSIDSTSPPPPPASASSGGTERRSLPPAFPNPPRRPDRSCVLCHRRKIRCDRQSPCLACVRGRLTCSYPASDKPVRRVRKTTIADVASRISDLEKTIVAASIDPVGSARHHSLAPAASPAHVTLPISPHSHESRPQEVKGLSEAVLVRNGSLSQYFNELLISRVIEEDQDKSSLLHTPHSDTKDQDADSPFSLMGILSSPSVFEEKDAGWRLSRLGAMQLWHIFVQNVDFCIKVLHVPTDEITIFTAIHQPESVSKDVMALVSAVNFASTVTMEADEVQHTLGVDKPTALKTFKKQLQKHLAEADMLENPTVVLLQGLTIYLTAMRTHNHGRGVWILNGLAVRMAHSIGLHRDGSKLGMTPFESEVRRRLWWHLLARDSKAAEDHGISSWSTVPSYDTNMPLNVDDSELRPDMRELPPSHSGWTRMSLPLTTMEVAETLQQMARLSATPTGSTPKEVTRSNMFSQLRARVEQYIKPCNPVIPVQRMTMKTVLCIVHKIDFVTRQQIANMENPDTRNSFATEENLMTTLRSLEIHLELWADELLRPYRWCMTSHPQYHMLLYVLWHLCVHPEGPGVDKAWDIVDRMFEVESRRLFDAVSGPALKYIVLQRLRTKAELIRQSITSGTDDAASPESGGHEGPNDEVMESSNQEELVDMRRFDSDNLDWSNIAQNVPDWNILVEDLHMDLHGFSSYF